MTTPPVSSGRHDTDKTTSGHTSGHTTSNRTTSGYEQGSRSENIDDGGRTIPMRPTPNITPGAVAIAPPPFLGAQPEYLDDLPELQTPVYPDGICPWYLAKLDRTVATAIVEGASSLVVPTPKGYYAAVDEARIETFHRAERHEPRAG